MENVPGALIKIVLVLLGALCFGACGKKQDPFPPEQALGKEAITSLALTFVDPGNASDIYTMRYSDPDGDGGTDAVVSSDPIPANRTLLLSLAVLNERILPALELTSEIASEGNDHQFFFQAAVVPFSISYRDIDANGYPIGLQNIAASGPAGSGTLRVTLLHRPTKGGFDVAGGDITNAGGLTDLEVVFPLLVE